MSGLLWLCRYGITANRRLPLCNSRCRSLRVRPRPRRSRSLIWIASRRSRANRCRRRHQSISLSRPSAGGAPVMSRGTAGLLLLIEFELLGEGACDARMLAYALKVVLHGRPLRQIDARKARPVQHDDEIRIGHRELIEQILPTLQVRIQI